MTAGAAVDLAVDRRGVVHDDEVARGEVAGEVVEAGMPDLGPGRPGPGDQEPGGVTGDTAFLRRVRARTPCQER